MVCGSVDGVCCDISWCVGMVMVCIVICHCVCGNGVHCDMSWCA